MRYKSFRIQNFKGIKDTTVELQSVAGANVFAFVGLNESGKTTLLEAVHSFSPDAATSELLGGDEGSGVPFKNRVPRHLISEFTGDVSVTAVVVATPRDKETIRGRALSSASLHIDDLPDEFILQRQQRFKGGDILANYFSLRTNLKVRSGKQRKWRTPDPSELATIRDIVFDLAPVIAYFPTFVFDFPKEFFLTERGGVADRFYRRVFQDILDYDGRGQTIEKDIVRRIRREEMVVPWLSFLSSWSGHDDKEKIQHVMDRVGAAVTKLVFGRWNQIFREDTRGEEVHISYEIVKGRLKTQKVTRYPAMPTMFL